MKASRTAPDMPLKDHGDLVTWVMNEKKIYVFSLIIITSTTKVSRTLNPKP